MCVRTCTSKFDIGVVWVVDHAHGWVVGDSYFYRDCPNLSEALKFTAVCNTFKGRIQKNLLLCSHPKFRESCYMEYDVIYGN